MPRLQAEAAGSRNQRLLQRVPIPGEIFFVESNFLVAYRHFIWFNRI